MGKYDSWDTFFAGLEGERVRMDLDRFEEVTGVTLPPSARRHHAWWSEAQYYAKWKAHGWRARPLLASNEVIFERRSAAPERQGGPPDATREAAQQVGGYADLILVGCVASKREVASSAKDLYTSALWQRRRAYAEASGKPWAILSAEYGLVDPDEVIEPYDRYLEVQPRAYREQWSRVTADSVISLARSLGVGSIEIHAGAAYCEHGLERQLRRAGFEVRRPLRGLVRGKQLAWYTTPAVEPQRGTDPASATRSGPSVRGTPEHVLRIADLYRSGALGESWAELPETMSLPPASPRQLRLWLTFTAAVDRARDPWVLWSNARRAWEQAPWVFDPDQIVRGDLAELVEVLRSYGVSQRHSTDAFAWRVIAESLVSAECPDAISSALGGQSADASEILSAVETVRRHGTPMFPLLSGPKISAMWVRMLAYPGGAPISGIEAIPVAVDTHVQRVTEMLGLVTPRKLDDRHRRDIQRVWFDAVAQAGAFGAPAGIDGTAAGIDPALWAMGKIACARCERDQRKVPVGEVCDVCVLGRVRQ